MEKAHFEISEILLSRLFHLSQPVSIMEGCNLYGTLCSTDTPTLPNISSIALFLMLLEWIKVRPKPWGPSEVSDFDLLSCCSPQQIRGIGWYLLMWWSLVTNTSMQKERLSRHLVVELDFQWKLLLSILGAQVHRKGNSPRGCYSSASMSVTNHEGLQSFSSISHFLADHEKD